MSAEKLLPCPFCAASGEELLMFCDPAESSDNSGPSRRVQCAMCHIELPYHPTKADAIAAWNRRALSASQEEITRLRKALEEARANNVAGRQNFHTIQQTAADLLRKLEAARGRIAELEIALPTHPHEGDSA